MAVSVFDASGFSYSRSLFQQVVESRVKSVLWQEDGRVALVEKARYYFLTEKRQSANEERQAQHSRNLCSIY